MIEFAAPHGLRLQHAARRPLSIVALLVQCEMEMAIPSWSATLESVIFWLMPFPRSEMVSWILQHDLNHVAYSVYSKKAIGAEVYLV